MRLLISVLLATILAASGCSKSDDKRGKPSTSSQSEDGAETIDPSVDFEARLKKVESRILAVEKAQPGMESALDANRSDLTDLQSAVSDLGTAIYHLNAAMVTQYTIQQLTQQITDLSTTIEALSSLSVTNSSVLRGNFAIENSMDLDFFRSVTWVTGNLTVSGNFQAQIALPNLRGVQGVLTIGDNLILSQISIPLLGTVGGLKLDSLKGPLAFALPASTTKSFELTNCVPGVSTSGLDALTVSDTVLIEGNTFTALPSLPGFSGLNGDLTVRQNTITSLAGLNAINSVGGNVAIQSNPELTSLTGLGGLVQVDGNFVISANPKLLNATGLASLSSVGGTLDFNDNDGMTSLTGLTSLNSVYKFTVGNNLLLTNISSIATLGTIQATLHVYSNPALTSLGLTGLISANWLLFDTNSSLCVTSEITPFKNRVSHQSFTNTGNKTIC